MGIWSIVDYNKDILSDTKDPERNGDFVKKGKGV